MPASIKQVQIRNFKSIGQAVVDLELLTALVGPNGSGKSNFVDALAFVQECLSDSIELAFKNRGGIAAVRRRSRGHPTHIGIRLRIELEDGARADYSFEIAAKPQEAFRVARERCIVERILEDQLYFEVKDGGFVHEIPGIRPRITPDRLALFAASATEEFSPVFKFLTSMRIYSIVPTRLRELQDADPGDLLRRDGGNAAAVLKRIRGLNGGSDRYDRLCRLLSKVVGGVHKVEYKTVGTKETLEFKQDVGDRAPWRFDALNMSDGTLRMLGLLLAVYQSGPSSLVAIEEPESCVHPAATELVTEVLLDASQERQIVVTTHSPDILDHKGLTERQIRVAEMEQGQTLLVPLAESSREAIRQHLYSPGELLRSNELNPDRSVRGSSGDSPTLFGPTDFDASGRA